MMTTKSPSAKTPKQVDLSLSVTMKHRDKNRSKPNTRFLRNLVRDTNSHNAALLAKVKTEKRARQRRLDVRARRSRADDESRGDNSLKRQRTGGERKGRWKSVLSRLGEPCITLRKRHGEKGHQEIHHESRDQRKTRSLNRKRDVKESTHYANHSHRRRRSRRPDSRSRSPQHQTRSERDRRSDNRCRSGESKDRQRNRSRDRRSRFPDHRHCPKSTAGSSDSCRETESTDIVPKSNNKASYSSNSDDPLSSFLDPISPLNPRPRGRGATAANRSAMDLRFNEPSYNSRTDIAQFDSEGEKDDWFTSLEVMQDCAGWREKGAQRLREAGFGRQDVLKWEGWRQEKDERDLRWRGKGEMREWDAGKVA